MTLTARQLYFEGTRVGDELPPLVKPPVDRLQIARYVGAAGDYNPLYVDEPHAKASGFPSTRAPGMIAMGFMAELATEWVRGARLRRFQSRFVKIVWPNDVLTARGRVIERRFEPGGVYTVDIELWAENQRGELVARGLATYQLYYSADDEARQRAGQPPLVVTPEEEEARLARLSRAQPQRAPAPPRPLQPARPIGLPAPAVSAPQPPRGAPPPPRAPPPQARPPSPAPRPMAPIPARPAPPPTRPAAPAAKPLPPPAARPAAPPPARLAPPARSAPKAAPRPAAKATARPAPRPAAKKPAKPSRKAPAARPAGRRAASPAAKGKKSRK